jgi:hypothetical protein
LEKATDHGRFFGKLIQTAFDCRQTGKNAVILALLLHLLRIIHQPVISTQERPHFLQPVLE